jgi:hypothetical protein
LKLRSQESVKEHALCCKLDKYTAIHLKYLPHAECDMHRPVNYVPDQDEPMNVTRLVAAVAQLGWLDIFSAVGKLRSARC